jgi:hypothetical protein
MPNYPKEQLLDLYKILPEDLQNAIFSQDNADKIFEICQKNGVKKDAIVSEIAKNTGYVMLGVLAPEELQKVFKKELGLKEKSAEQIASEINELIFLPVRKYIEALYNTDLTPITTPKITAGAKVKAEIIAKTARAKNDAYREPIE